MTAHRDLWRVLAPSKRPLGRPVRFAILALGALAVASGAGFAVAQGLTEQQMRCMQLQQELAAGQGGGAGREELPRIEQQIQQNDRVFQGTQAAMEDAGCYESFFIFGRGLVRSPKCLKMNDRVEDARRQLTQLQQQREAILRGGSNKRRQAELTNALARSGCGGQVRTPPRKGRGGLFDWFGGEEQEQQPEQPQTPIYRSIDPNGRYRSVCVRLCDGFFYPVREYAYGSQLGQDADRCQSNCAAPAELYVYRNGQEIEQAISLNGAAYMDLPVALKYRKEYVTGCSCKQVEYNPTEIEAANKKAEADAAAKPEKGKPGKKKPAPAPVANAAPEAAPGTQPPPPQLDLDLTGSNQPADAASAGAAPPAQPAPQPEVKAEKPPAPPAAAPPAPPPAASADAAEPAPGQSTVAKKSKAPPAPQ